MKKSLLSVVLLMGLICCSMLATQSSATTYTTLSEGSNGGTWGSDTYHSVLQKKCEVGVHTFYGSVTGWAWVGIEVTLDSAEYIYMSAVLTYTGYIWGGKMNVYLRAIKSSDWGYIQWTVNAYEKKDSIYTWSAEYLYLGLGDFPKYTPSGTWIFLVHLEYTGNYGWYLQKTPTDSGRSVLSISSITVYY